MKRVKFPVMAAFLAVSMGVTEGLMIWQGRWRETIPLHLCSICALLAFFCALGLRGNALDFLWYMGLPGALLALLFPAPAVSRCQELLNLSYIITHMMIVLIPLACIKRGIWPRPGRVWQMMLMLQGIALSAFFVNHVLGTDFLFLAAPPEGTPLEDVYALGYPIYLLFMEGMMLLLCCLQSVLLRCLMRFSRG